jgi:hypothetical protein
MGLLFFLQLKLVHRRLIFTILLSWAAQIRPPVGGYDQNDWLWQRASGPWTGGPAVCSENDCCLQAEPCVSPCSLPWGFAGYFLFLFCLVIVGYAGGGVVYSVKVRGKSPSDGIDQLLPHHAEWDAVLVSSFIHFLAAETGALAKDWRFTDKLIFCYCIMNFQGLVRDGINWSRAELERRWVGGRQGYTAVGSDRESQGPHPTEKKKEKKKEERGEKKDKSKRSERATAAANTDSKRRKQPRESTESQRGPSGDASTGAAHEADAGWQAVAGRTMQEHTDVTEQDVHPSQARVLKVAVVPGQ